MKVLFVGEGKTDIGPAEFGMSPQPARGPVFHLARKIVPHIDEEGCPAVRWSELTRFPPPDKKKGFEAKVAKAILVSARLHNCQGTICVADCDGDPTRLEDMIRGRDRGIEAVGGDHACACGLAVESIEAWTLGAPEAIAEVLEIDITEVRKCYPGKNVEELSEQSGKPEFHPKSLLDRIAQLKHRVGDVEFREEVAVRTQVDRLEVVCTRGFKPFAKALREAFPQAADEAGPDSESPTG